MERYEKKQELIREEEFDDLKINPFDRTIALLVKGERPADGSTEIGRIINRLKADKNFRKCSEFLDVFRDKISTYDE